MTLTVNMSEIYVSSLRFLPEIGAFGVVDRAQDALLGGGDVAAKFLYQTFHELAFSGVVGRAGVLDDGEPQAVHSAFDVAFLNVDKGADERYAALVHIRRGGEAGESAFVKQGHERGFRHIVRIVSEGEFASSQPYYLAVKGASAEFRAEGAGVGLLSCVEHYLRDIRFDYMTGDAQVIAEPRYGVRRGDGSVLEAHVYGDGLEVEAFGGELSVRGERSQQQYAVLASRKPDEDPVAVRDHLVVLYRPAHGGEYLLHTVIIAHIRARAKRSRFTGASSRDAARQDKIKRPRYRGVYVIMYGVGPRYALCRLHALSLTISVKGERV